MWKKKKNVFIWSSYFSSWVVCLIQHVVEQKAFSILHYRLMQKAADSEVVPLGQQKWLHATQQPRLCRVYVGCVRLRERARGWRVPHTLLHIILWHLAEAPCVEEMLLHTYQHTHKERLKADPTAHTFSQASHVSAVSSKWDPLPRECERGRSLLEAGGRLGVGEAATSLSAVWTCYYGWRWQGAGMSYVCMCVWEFVPICASNHLSVVYWEKILQ